MPWFFIMFPSWRQPKKNMFLSPAPLSVFGCVCGWNRSPCWYSHPISKAHQRPCELFFSWLQWLFGWPKKRRNDVGRMDFFVKDCESDSWNIYLAQWGQMESWIGEKRSVSWKVNGQRINQDWIDTRGICSIHIANVATFKRQGDILDGIEQKPNLNLKTR